MAVEAADASTAQDLALSDTDINWHRLDKTRFHLIGSLLFTAQSTLLHPIAFVKTRMQVSWSGLSHKHGLSVFTGIMKEGVPGLFRGFGTSAIGCLPSRVRSLTLLEVSEDMMLKYRGSRNA